MEKQIQDKAKNSNMVKDPDDWTTGDEPMTGAQKSLSEHVMRRGWRRNG